ncbi:hypothetical protein L209DRAFT_753402 [Thermothelomyces heterothallicus CBS 203.75]
MTLLPSYPSVACERKKDSPVVTPFLPAHMVSRPSSDGVRAIPPLHKSIKAQAMSRGRPTWRENVHPLLLNRRVGNRKRPVPHAVTQQQEPDA